MVLWSIQVRLENNRQGDVGVLDARRENFHAGVAELTKRRTAHHLL